MIDKQPTPTDVTNAVNDMLAFVLVNNHNRRTQQQPPPTRRADSVVAA